MVMYLVPSFYLVIDTGNKTIGLQTICQALFSKASSIKSSEVKP